MKLDLALNELNGLAEFLQDYRANGFTSALITAKEVIETLDLDEEPKFVIPRRPRRNVQ